MDSIYLRKMNDSDLLLDALIDEDNCLSDITSIVRAITFTYQDVTRVLVNRSGITPEFVLESEPTVTFLDNEYDLVRTFWESIVGLCGGVTPGWEQPVNAGIRFYGWEITDRLWPLMATKAMYYNSMHATVLGDDTRKIYVPKGLLMDLGSKWFKCENLINIDGLYKQGRSSVTRACKLTSYQALAYLGGMICDDSEITPDCRDFGVKDVVKLKQHMGRMKMLLQTYWTL